MDGDDIDSVIAVIQAASTANAGTGPRQPSSLPSSPPSEETRSAIRAVHTRFLRRDGPGAWVATTGGEVVGVAESIRRAGFWGLSMLFVHPEFQSQGIGGRLLEATMGYAAGASQRMIESSADPRAMRRYFLAGLAMHPAAEMHGVPDRRGIPRSLPVREGGPDDLDLVASVESHLGRSRAEDVAFVLADERFRLDVVDNGPGRGWVLSAPDRLIMLGATDEATAAALLWRHIGAGDREVRASGITAVQQWAFAVAHEARLSLRSSGALFVDGMAVPGPWIPSGWFF